MKSVWQLTVDRKFAAQRYIQLTPRVNIFSNISNNFESIMIEFATTPPTLTSIASIVESLFGFAPAFIFGTETTPYLGSEYAVFALEVKEAGLRVCVRLLREPAGVQRSHLLSREVELRQCIESANTHPFQNLIAFDTSSDNALQSP